MRLFFALWPAFEVAEQLAGVAQSVAKAFGGKPSRQDSLHLTLAFLGDVPDDQVFFVTQAARCVHAVPLALNIGRLGYWQRKQLLWAGETVPSAALVDLADRLQRALNQAGIPITGRRPIFSPHITLVRDFPEARQPSVPTLIDTISWPCSSFALIRSQRSDAGSFYETVADFPLSELSGA